MIHWFYGMGWWRLSYLRKTGFLSYDHIYLILVWIIIEPLCSLNEKISLINSWQKYNFTTKPDVQYLRGFLSMHTCWKICCRKDGGVSCTTCCTLSRVFKYSINLLIKFTKCPACLIFPGTASSKISSGKTGLDNTVSVSLAALASRNPWTSLLYSSLNLLASLSLILTEKTHTYVGINIK